MAIITTQARAVLTRFQERTGYAVRLLSDTTRAITKAYGVLDRGGFLEAFILKTRYPVKSLFLVDRNGHVAWRHVAKDKADNPDMDTIKEAVTGTLSSEP